MYRSFNFNHKLFIFFIFTLLVEGIYSAYYYKISDLIDYLPFKSQSSINPYIWNENGLVEILQVSFLIIALFYIIFLTYKKKFKSESKIFNIFFYLYTIGLIYYFFEEISWGQHVFFWNTPEFFLNINNQNETNFHNTTNLLNEVPRTLLLVWCAFSFMFFYLLRKLKKYNNFKIFILPNENLKKISLLLIFFVLPDIVVDKFNLHPGYPIDWITEIRLYEVIDVLTFNFIRLSELHELIFNYYILVHAYYLKTIYISK